MWWLILHKCHLRRTGLNGRAQSLAVCPVVHKEGRRAGAAALGLSGSTAGATAPVGESTNLERDTTGSHLGGGKESSRSSRNHSREFHCDKGLTEVRRDWERSQGA